MQLRRSQRASHRRESELPAAQGRNGPQAAETPEPEPKIRLVVPPHERNALAGALLFVALGFAGIYVVAKVADVRDGTALAALLIVPAVLYLLLSGRVSDLKGPGGLEVQLTQVANQTIPLAGQGRGTTALAFEAVRSVEKGRTESFLSRIRDITPEDPVVLTLTVGSGRIDGPAAAAYAKGLTQFPRFRFVAVVDSHRKLISYMDATAFRHVIEAEVIDANALLKNIEDQDVGAVRAFPGMIVATVSPRTSIADALRRLDRLRLSALLVTDEGEIKGIAEQDRLANALLLSLVDSATGRA